MSTKMPSASRIDAAALAVSRDRAALAALEQAGRAVDAESFAEAYTAVLDAEQEGRKHNA